MRLRAQALSKEEREREEESRAEKNATEITGGVAIAIGTKEKNLELNWKKRKKESIRRRCSTRARTDLLVQ